MVALADLTRAGFIAGDISTVMSPRTVITWAENAASSATSASPSGSPSSTSATKSSARCVAEYYQRCFGKELPASSGKGGQLPEARA